MKTGDHILQLSSTRGDAILTNGHAFGGCSCRVWKTGALPRTQIRDLHREHVDEMAEREQAYAQQ